LIAGLSEGGIGVSAQFPAGEVPFDEEARQSQYLAIVGEFRKPVRMFVKIIRSQKPIAPTFVALADTKFLAELIRRLTLRVSVHHGYACAENIGEQTVMRVAIAGDGLEIDRTQSGMKIGTKAIEFAVVIGPERISRCREDCSGKCRRTRNRAA